MTVKTIAKIGVKLIRPKSTMDTTLVLALALGTIRYGSADLHHTTRLIHAPERKFFFLENP